MHTLTTVLLGVPWWIPVLVYIIAAYVAVRWLGKYLADQPDQIKRLTVNMGLCAVAGTLFAAATGGFSFTTTTLLVVGVGVLNGFANITQWRASRISMSKTSLLSFGDDIIAVLLAIALIGDGRYLNAVSAMGMALCFATGVLFWWHDKKNGGESAHFYLCVMLYSVLWGVADFSQRYFAIEHMNAGQFVFAWYLGSSLALGTVFLGRKFLLPLLALRSAYFRTVFHNVQVETGKPYRAKDIGLIFVFAVGLCTCLAIEYWAKVLAPQTVVGPILLVSEALIPTTIGLWIFKEGRGFDKHQWGFAALGIIGVSLLAFGFHG